MMDALYNGITGLNTFQNALNSEANNVANINTVGYKAGTISFADQLYGNGVRIETVNKNFSQSELKMTGNPYDMAVEGSGFFAVKDNIGTVNYTRAGNFRMAVDGTLQTLNDYNVLGFQALPTYTVDANNVKQIALDPDTQEPLIVTTDDNLADDDPGTLKFDARYSEFITTNTIMQNQASTDMDPEQRVANERVETFNARATNYYLTAQDDLIENSGNNYKTADNKINDVRSLLTTFRNSLTNYESDPSQESVAATKQNVTIDFTSYPIESMENDVRIFIGDTTLIQEFDTDKATTLKNLADRISGIDGVRASYDGTNLNIENMVPGEDVIIDDIKVSGEAIDAANIERVDAIAGSGYAQVRSIEDALKEAVEIAGAEYLRISNVVSYTPDGVSNNDPYDPDNPDMAAELLAKNKEGTDQLTTLQLNLDELDVSSSPFGDFETENGYLYVNQDGSRFVVGRVATARFVNDAALESVGGNLFVAKNSEVGQIKFLGISDNKIHGETLEMSNADMSASLVDLMVYQRAFEASSKSVTTSDEFLKTAIALKN